MLPRTTVSVVFFCKKTKVTKKGKAPIYARITTTGQSTEVYATSPCPGLILQSGKEESMGRQRLSPFAGTGIQSSVSGVE